MDLNDVSTELEDDLFRRQEELVFLKNLLTSETRDDRKRFLSRTLLVMLYAHWEGFCRHAFTVYVNAVNSQKLKRSEVVTPIAAACISSVLRKFYTVPVSGVPRFEMEKTVDFLDTLEKTLGEIADIPAPQVVNTKSNLKPAVVSEILYRLGLATNLLVTYDSHISNLVERRNPIAHGDRISGLSEDQYLELEDQVLRAMSDVKSIVINAFARQHFLKKAT